MATESRRTSPHLRGGALDRLLREPYEFDFFQAVRLLEQAFPTKKAIGRRALPQQEVVRFRAHQSLAFPPSSLTELLLPDADNPNFRMTVAFMGLTGPSGALPLHYTQLLLDLYRDVRTAERRAFSRRRPRAPASGSWTTGCRASVRHWA